MTETSLLEGLWGADLTSASHLTPLLGLIQMFKNFAKPVWLSPLGQGQWNNTLTVVNRGLHVFIWTALSYPRRCRDLSIT